MTILTESSSKIFISTQAQLLDLSRDMASSWAAKHIYEDPAKKWILGNYVEADNANNNGQYWRYEDLLISQPTISNTPMNIDHKSRNIVGTWVASEMVIPTQDNSNLNSYIETLGVFWRYYFAEEMAKVESAYDAGTLWISMECVGDTVTCGGDHGCGQEFAYMGPSHESYCSHINDRASYRVLNNPHFLAGALILPGNRPGWSSADVKDISKFTTDEECEKIIRDIAKASPDASPEVWESLMWQLQMAALQDKAKLK